MKVRVDVRYEFEITAGILQENLDEIKERLEETLEGVDYLSCGMLVPSIIYVFRIALPGMNYVRPLETTLEEDAKRMINI